MIVVVGTGVTGRAVQRWADARGEEVLLVDDADPRPADAVDTSAGLSALAEADLIVPSPGVMLSHPVITTAREMGVAISSEIDLASSACSATLVAVTGTNGKTTVTTLIDEMLRRSGITATTAGNIGRPLLDTLDEDVEVVVIEVSSFQLATSRSFRPHVAVLLNIADDHLDWHGSFEAYVAAKARIFARQAGDDVLLYNGDDQVVADLAGTAPALRRSFSGVSGDSNLVAAMSAARLAGATDDGISDAVAAFHTLPHRVASVGEAGGVHWVNDSKATNPAATSHAVARFDCVVLIAGGRNKGLDLGTLRRHDDRLRAVVAIGESANEVEAAFTDLGRPVRRAGSMAAAVAEAAALACPGDTVLLSPACTSLDWYRNYEERGDDFVAEVRSLIGSSGR